MTRERKRECMVNSPIITVAKYVEKREKVLQPKPASTGLGEEVEYELNIQ